MRIIIIVSILMLTPFAVLAQDAITNSLTIYSSASPGGISPEMYRPTPGATPWNYGGIPGYGIVRNTRNVILQSQRSEVKISDVAAYIDPTTVTFKSLADPNGTSVLEQNYNFDLVSVNKLAERYVGETISFQRQGSFGEAAGEVENGKLLSAQTGQLVVQKKDGSIVSTFANLAIFPKLPGELYSKPTLIWDINTNKPGQHEIETSYETGGMTWWADYNVVYADGMDANSGFLDVGAWVTIVNMSGASYADAKLKLIAGDVQKVTPERRGYNALAKSAVMESMADDAGFSEKSFFEYHLYTLGRKTSLTDNSTKQVELFPTASKVPVEKLLVYNGAAGVYNYGGANYDKNYGTTDNKKVDVYLKFKNSKENNMGMPLPKGRVRVNKLDNADSTLEFIGEDTIDHTPKNEEVLLRLGNAFDVVGERKQTDFQVDHSRRWMKESFEITLRNHKEEKVRVIVKEGLYRGANWKILEASDDYEKKNVQNIEFAVEVPKNAGKVVKYTAEYTW